MSSKTDDLSEYASPSCFAHELEYSADGISVVYAVIASVTVAVSSIAPSLHCHLAL